MIRINTQDEVDGIRESARIVAKCLQHARGRGQARRDDPQLDRLAEEFIRDQGGEPAFKGYRGFPASICASVNEEVVHGIPAAKRVLEEATSSGSTSASG